MQKKKINVAIQGIATSFHDIVARRYFGDQIRTIECLSFYDLCISLQQRESDFAIMAIENSIAGSILPNYILLQQFHFFIVGEIYHPIHMHLVALPGVTLSQIRHIESHPMAIRQCGDFLHSLHHVSIRESADTAASAKMIAHKKLKNTAAIANEQSAEAFGLQIIEKRIETHKKNFTRFLALSYHAIDEGKADKASLCFEVKKQIGSLADTLTTLKSCNINLSRIQSVPIVGNPNEYTIHVDVEWKRKKDYDKALKMLVRQVRNLSVLGEYKGAKIKYK